MPMAEPTTSPTTSAPRRRSTATDIALIAAFAALIAACAVVGGIPVGGAGVDITLQTFGVLLAGCVLGMVRGFLAVSLYLLLGAIGLPVFAGHTGGLSVFTGVSAGYLISFPFAAALAGFLVLYTMLLVIEMYLMVKFVRQGPSSLHLGRYHFETGARAVPAE